MTSETLRVEFHCHTRFSGDCLLKPSKLVEAARRKGLDRVVVTDHNSIDGALEAREIDPERIIVGEEILTTQGEILAVFVKQHVPPFLSPLETIHRLRDQGAFISVSHPFDAQRGWKESDLIEILPYVDAIETFNSRCMNPMFNIQAQKFARVHGVAGTVGSDAHTAWELGRAALTLHRFVDSDDLRRVIRRGQARVRLSPPFFIRTASRCIAMIKKTEGRVSRLQALLDRSDPGGHDV